MSAECRELLGCTMQAANLLLIFGREVRWRSIDLDLIESARQCERGLIKIATGDPVSRPVSYGLVCGEDNRSTAGAFIESTSCGSSIDENSRFLGVLTLRPIIQMAVTVSLIVASNRRLSFSRKTPAPQQPEFVKE